jgi:N-acetylglucosamine kinase-like BadF-type ATPase
VAIFLGIDGGGSKTSCAIGDETSLLGTGTSGGSNVVRVGEAQARVAIASVIRQACAAANIVPTHIQRTCVGLAGGARSEVSDLVRRTVAESVSGEIDVVGDMVIVLEAAFGAGPGVIVIAGTGSIAYGRDRKGETVRAGGWGFAISDEGSGQWIGRSAVSAAIRAVDDPEGSSSSALLEGLMKSWGLGSREQLIIAANATPAPDFAALMPAVLSAADNGDPLARGVLTEAGAELANLAKTVLRRLFPEAESIPVAMSGGVFGNSALVRQVFYNSVRAEFRHAAIIANVVEPVHGALALARKGGPF